MNRSRDLRPVVAGVQWLRAQRRAAEKSWSEDVVSQLGVDARVAMSVAARSKVLECKQGVPSGKWVGRKVRG